MNSLAPSPIKFNRQLNLHVQTRNLQLKLIGDIWAIIIIIIIRQLVSRQLSLIDN